jgi:hypothetical protein
MAGSGILWILGVDRVTHFFIFLTGTFSEPGPYQLVCPSRGREKGVYQHSLG